MKYLRYELSDQTLGPNGELYKEEWERQCNLYHKEFESISSRLPKLFLDEYRKKEFHDFKIESLYLTMRCLKSGYKYDLEIKFLDYCDEKIHHYLYLIDVNSLKGNFDFMMAGNFDWIYAEILSVDDHRLSLEVRLFDDSNLYLEFSKLRYRKVMDK